MKIILLVQSLYAVLGRMEYRAVTHLNHIFKYVLKYTCLGSGISRGALQGAGGTFSFHLAYLIRQSSMQDISVSVM